MEPLLPRNGVTLKRALLVAALVCGALSAAVPAVAMLPTAVVSLTGNPVYIQHCYWGRRDTDVGNKDYYNDFGVIFTNAGDKPITAVRFRFDYFNAFSEHLGTEYGIDSHPLGPGQTRNDAQANQKYEAFTLKAGFEAILPSWEAINTVPTANKVICSVYTVAFADGTKWQADEITADTFNRALPNATVTMQGIFAE